VSVDQELFGDRLPTYLTRFLGRRRELTELRELCDGASLITICGIGGLGKTRLAIELARSLRSDPGPVGPLDEVVWVPLIAVTDGGTVAAVAAAGLGLAVPSGRQAVVAVGNALRGRRTLIILDNCEQVAAAAADLVCSLRDDDIDALVVATSRIPLECSNERVYAVPPMSSDALDLFVDRARTVAPPTP
jgi:predicted ATPase